MKEKWQHILLSLEPYTDVLLFVAALFVSNGLWKLAVHGEEAYGAMVTCLGVDITGLFSALSEWTCDAAYSLLCLVTDSVYRFGKIGIGLDQVRLQIVWSCTPVKQSFIFLCIMLASRGYSSRDWLHKAWFIPMGWLLIVLINILRIVAIALLCAPHPEQFVFWHEYVMKYLFYGFIFLLWLSWQKALR